MSNKLSISIPTQGEPLPSSQMPLTSKGASLQMETILLFIRNHCTVFLPPLHYHPPFLHLTSKIPYCTQSIFKDGSLIKEESSICGGGDGAYSPHLKTLLYHRASPKLPKYPPSVELIGPSPCNFLLND